MKDKKQEGAENSQNYQGETVNIYNGLSYSDVKDIVIDLFKSNFIQLKAEAMDIAQKRAEEITETFLNQLQEKSPESLGEFQQPSMQNALFTVQKQYAMSGDKNLGDLLVDILIDRAETSNRNMLQIVLDESLNIAPKLTFEQLDTLTISFLMSRTRRLTIGNLEEFAKYLNTKICPFIELLDTERHNLNHLEYLGCGHTRAGNYGNIENTFIKNYQAVFANGFSREEFEEQVGEMDRFNKYIIPNLHDNEKFQINILTTEALNTDLEKSDFSDDEKKKLVDIFQKYTMSVDQVKIYLVSINPLIEKLLNLWRESTLKSFELTSVGIAIAHANYRRKTSETMDLSIWIK